MMRKNLPSLQAVRLQIAQWAAHFPPAGPVRAIPGRDNQRIGDGPPWGQWSAVPLPPLSLSDFSMGAGSPLVSLEHRLVFCETLKVGCTKWRQFFRRLGGDPYWGALDANWRLRMGVHKDNLLRLKNLDFAQASAIMARDSGYFFATVIRDPLERLLSGFLNKCWYKHIHMAPCIQGASGRGAGGVAMASLAGAGSHVVDDGANRTRRGGSQNTQGHTMNGERSGISTQDPFGSLQGESNARTAMERKGRRMPVEGRLALEGNGGVQSPSQGHMDSNGPGDSVAAFASTVQYFAELSPGQMDLHFLPQAYFCDRYKYLPRYDAVARSDDDIYHMLSRLGLWEPFAASGWGPGANLSMLEFTNYHSVGVRADARESDGPQPAAHSLLKRYYTSDVLAVALSVLQVDYELFRLPIPGWALQVQAAASRERGQ
eukprot:jgi/Mesvir1/25129/Mv21587-RA.1